MSAAFNHELEAWSARLEPEIEAEADLVVEGPAGVRRLLEMLVA